MQKSCNHNYTILESLPCAYAVKDKHSRYIYANELYKNLLGTEATGKSDDDFAMFNNYAQLYRARDTEVMRTKKRIKTLEVNNFANGWQAYVFTKTPLIEEGSVTGVVVQGYNAINNDCVVATDLLANAFAIQKKDFANKKLVSAYLNPTK